jgi:hypothetical protein
VCGLFDGICQGTIGKNGRIGGPAEVEPAPGKSSLGPFVSVVPIDDTAPSKLPDGACRFVDPVEQWKIRLCTLPGDNELTGLQQAWNGVDPPGSHHPAASKPWRVVTKPLAVKEITGGTGRGPQEVELPVQRLESLAGRLNLIV